MSIFFQICRPCWNGTKWNAQRGRDSHKITINLHYSYPPASERTKWLYISVSAAMTMQNVVNPTFWERKNEYRTDVLSVGPCSRNGYELCRLSQFETMRGFRNIFILPFTGVHGNKAQLQSGSPDKVRGTWTKNQRDTIEVRNAPHSLCPALSSLSSWQKTVVWPPQV